VRLHRSGISEWSVMVWTGRASRCRRTWCQAAIRPHVGTHMWTRQATLLFASTHPPLRQLAGPVPQPDARIRKCHSARIKNDPGCEGVDKALCVRTHTRKPHTFRTDPTSMAPFRTNPTSTALKFWKPCAVHAPQRQHAVGSIGECGKAAGHTRGRAGRAAVAAPAMQL